MGKLVRTSFKVIQQLAVMRRHKTINNVVFIQKGFCLLLNNIFFIHQVQGLKIL